MLDTPKFSASTRFRNRSIKLVLAFLVFWGLVISGAALVNGCASADMSRLTKLSVGCERAKLPLRVSFADDASALAPNVMGAAETWSTSLGVSVARLAGPGEQVDLVITDVPRNPMHPDWDAQVEVAKDPDGRCYKTMAFMTGFDFTQEYFMALHEWGHVLGLKDSTADTSVMFHWVSPSLMGGGSGPNGEEPNWPSITTGDIETLKATYYL